MSDRVKRKHLFSRGQIRECFIEVFIDIQFKIIIVYIKKTLRRGEKSKSSEIEKDDSNPTSESSKSLSEKVLLKSMAEKDRISELKSVEESIRCQSY
jgi:hypothetical protein